MADRPMVNVYEPNAGGDEELVYREMTDDELEVWLADRAAWEAEQERPATHPVVEAVAGMNEDELAALRELLDR